MTFEDVNSIRLLKSFFDECRLDKGDSSSDSDPDGDFPNVASALSPASVKSKKGQVKKTLENSLMVKIDEKSAAKSMQEWEQQQTEDEELLDTRKQPEYQIVYKQAVTTEDIYLQMGLKTAATSSCEDMVIDIQLPEEIVTIDSMDLDVEADSIHLQTPVYRLKLSLPHKIDPKKGKAAFDSDKKLLKLTLRMKRELDFVNF